MQLVSSNIILWSCHFDSKIPDGSDGKNMNHVAFSSTHFDRPVLIYQYDWFEWFLFHLYIFYTASQAMELK